MIIFIAVTYAFIALFLFRNYLAAHKRYTVTYKYDVWTVRDSRGRFVTCSSSWWDVCKVGL